MGYLKFLNSIVIFTISILLFTGCNPSEPKLELQLKEQAIGYVFTFADYCKEKYDSIYIIHPYEDKNFIYSLPYKMSNRLRGYCSYTLDDTRVTALLISNRVVKAYTEIPAIDACFAYLANKNVHIFPFDQKFIMDKERYVHIYNE